MQEIIVYVILAFALLWVVVRCVKLFRQKGKTTGEGCEGCPLKKNCSRRIKGNGPKKN